MRKLIFVISTEEKSSLKMQELKISRYTRNDNMDIFLRAIRMEDAQRDEKLAAVKAILSEYGDQLKDSFSTYKNGKLRIRK